ncbi:hypothetical protein PoB_006727600 [Plakobranchus ocellatus]|uniref:Uncharacterized protein n=1 Tax=Plakobranchus ocellatus TaxID=259542 RepID=A0AAV4DA11_9GAST|nr:hypothetical protein PoB_006727600 [Plakobranchus ocellatus]
MTFNLLSQLIDRSTNEEDEDVGSPDVVGDEIDDESDVDFDIEEGEGDVPSLDSSDDNESECRSRSSSSPTAKEFVFNFFQYPIISLILSVIYDVKVHPISYFLVFGLFVPSLV